MILYTVSIPEQDRTDRHVEPGTNPGDIEVVERETECMDMYSILLQTFRINVE